MTTATLEIARFRAAVTDEFFAARERAMEALQREFTGYVSSRLIRDADGVLADEVVWASLAEAKRAAAAAPSVPDLAAYFANITESVSLDHADILVTWAGATAAAAESSPREAE